jgi:hypothetical protein
MLLFVLLATRLNKLIFGQICFQQIMDFNERIRQNVIGKHFFLCCFFWVLEYIHGFVAMSVPELKAFYCQDTLTKVIYCDFNRMLTI